MPQNSRGATGSFVELALSFHLYMGVKDQTQVSLLVWQAPKPTEPSRWPLNSFFFCSKDVKTR